MTAQATIENTIAGLENKYLEETNTAGNIIKGFDNYIKASTSATASSSGPGTATRRKGGVSDQDRIFSRSSVSWAVQAGHTSPFDECSADGVRRIHRLYHSISESPTITARRTRWTVLASPLQLVARVIHQPAVSTRHQQRRRKRLLLKRRMLMEMSARQSEEKCHGPPKTRSLGFCAFELLLRSSDRRWWIGI